VIPFCTDAEQRSSRITNQPTEMELQILHLERIPSTVFRKPTTEIRHGIDELVCDLQEQLHVASATEHDTREHGATYILHLGFDPHIGINARDEVLYRSSHTLIARRILPPCPSVLDRERRRIITPRDLRRRPCQRHRTPSVSTPSEPARTDLTSCRQTSHPSTTAFPAAPSPMGQDRDSSC
jgi:hypothetical protein